MVNLNPLYKSSGNDSLEKNMSTIANNSNVAGNIEICMKLVFGDQLILFCENGVHRPANRAFIEPSQLPEPLKPLPDSLLTLRAT